MPKRAPDQMRFLVGLLLCCLPVAVAEQMSPAAAAELVRVTVNHELKAGRSNFMFCSRKQTPHGSQTHLYVTSKEATVGMLVAVNDRPLDPTQRQAESDRLDHLANNPSELRRKQKQETDNADRVTRIVRAMPDAFTYQYDGMDQGSDGIAFRGDPLVRLKFQPNPKYQPPTRVEQVLTGMHGVILIDANKQRIAKVDGTLYRDVSFGWGFFGRLNKGGKFQIEQAQVSEDAWEITRMELNFKGRILLFKSLVINSSEVFSNFQKVPAGLSFAEGVALLKKQKADHAGTRN